MNIFRFAVVFLCVFFLFGCSFVLTKNMPLPSPPSVVSDVREETQDLLYLRYFTFQHANSTERQAQLELLNASGQRTIQALLLQGESFDVDVCGTGAVIYFGNFLDVPDYDRVGVSVTMRGRTTQFNLSRNDGSALLLSCAGVTKTTRTFSTRNEAPLVIVGEKRFSIVNDTMTDTWCYVRSSVREGELNRLAHQDWYSRNYDGSNLRRYMFRPNTYICDGNTDYFLAEDDLSSKQCYTYLGRRPSDSVGCRNLEGLMGNPDLR